MRRQLTCTTIVFAFFFLVVGTPGTAAAKRQGWEYNTDYLYGMTRGVRDNRDASAGMNV